MTPNLLALAAAAAVQDMPPGDDGQEIIVIGRGLPPGRGENVYDLIVIGRERLVHTPSTRLEEVLRDVPGFQQFRRSDARSANPTSQGATLRALGGNASSRALVLVDGVPQTDPFGGWIAWPSIDPRRLSQVRVMRGGGTGALGPGALAGTIDASSVGPDELAGLTAEGAYGSRDSLDAFAGFGTRNDAGFAVITAAVATGDGFTPIIAPQRGPADRPSPYDQASFAGRAGVTIGPALELQGNVMAFTDSRERGIAFSDIDTKGADASLRVVGRSSLPFSALAHVQFRDFSNDFASVDDGREVATPTLNQYSVPSTGLGARLEIRPVTGESEVRIGADWRETVGHTNELYQFADGAFLRGRKAGGRTRTIGAYAEYGREAGPWTFSAGARLDRWWILDGSLHERLLATGETVTDTQFADRNGWEVTGRAGIGYRVSEALRVRGAAYRGWRLPTLNELYRPFRVGADATAANAALAPELMTGAEAGLEAFPLPGLRLGATLFLNRLEDAIGNVTLGEGPGTFPGVGFVRAGGRFRQRQNIDAVESRGIEFDLSFARGPWNFTAGWSFADAVVEADGAAEALDGLRPAQAPRHSGSASLSWEGQRGARALVVVRYVGSQFEDDLNAVRIDDAVNLDASASWPISRGISVFARAENLTDARVVSGISGAGIIERATPRTLWIGLRWGG